MENQEYFVFGIKTKIISFILIAVGLLTLLINILSPDLTLSTSYPESTSFLETKIQHKEGFIKEEKVLDKKVEKYKPDYHKKRIWGNILINNYYFISIALAAIVFITVQYLSNAHWAVLIKRIPEAMASFLPVGLILMGILIFGIHSLYHWSHVGTDPHLGVDKIIVWKQGYLNEPFFIIRILLYFITWIAFSWIMKRLSDQDDISIDHNLKRYHKNNKISILFLLFFTLTYSFASYDWIMSTDSHFFSTMYSVNTFAGLFYRGIAVIALITIILKEMGYLKEVNENHFHDLGKFIFAFGIFWVYTWFFQLMLIWYANMPEETRYYIERLNGDVNVLLLIINIIINWFIPFFVLMSRPTKRNPIVLKWMAILLIIGHWVDTFILVMPSIMGGSTQIGFLEIGVFLGYVGLFIFVFAYSLSKKPLIIKHHPLLEESIRHHQ